MKFEGNLAKLCSTQGSNVKQPIEAGAENVRDSHVDNVEVGAGSKAWCAKESRCHKKVPGEGYKADDGSYRYKQCRDLARTRCKFG